MLRIAVQSKGRLNEDTMLLLQETGIKLVSDKRTLLVPSKNFPVELLFLRDDDIPQSVASGIADVGVVGENEFCEKKENADIYLRGDATEENVKREGELKKFNYVHFATHGFIDESKPDLSSLVLTQDKNSEEDGFLQATEIFNLNLNYAINFYNGSQRLLNHN